MKIAFIQYLSIVNEHYFFNVISQFVRKLSRIPIPYIYIYIYIYIGESLRRECPRGVMVIREFVLQSRYYVHFGQIPLGKVWTPLSSQLWVK